MSISDKIRQVNPRQRKSVKSAPVSEGGLGLSPRTSGSIEGDIRKAKENKLAKYWYDKYEELVKEVSYQRKVDRQNLNELDEKVQDMNKDLLSEITTISESDPLAPLDQKFVTLDKFADHYRTMIGRLQEQIATIGAGGLGEIADDPAPRLGVNLDLNSKDITGTGNITHTGNITTTGNSSVSGTLGVQGVTTFSDEDVIFNASEAVFSIIQKMIDDNITVCGVRDGGDVKHRNYSPYVINTFFSIINLEEVLAIWNKKEMLNHQYIKENEFSEDLSQLKFDYDASSLYEPYYCFYFWLRRLGKRFLFLDTQMDSDDISNEVFYNNEKVLCHTWYARSYNTNKKHTERIDLHLKKNINTKAKAFGDDVIFFNDKLFGFNQKLAKLSRKVKMKLKG